MGAISQAFERAGQEFHVPFALLEAICYMEGRLSMNGGRPSVDNGFGCMHLVQNSSGDPLDRAARELGVNANQLKLDMPTNIRGGAALLRDYALLAPRTRIPLARDGYPLIGGCFAAAVAAALLSLATSGWVASILQLLALVRNTTKAASRQKIQAQELHKIPYTFALLLGWFTQLTLMRAGGLL